jgi:hypothetical protein
MKKCKHCSNLVSGRQTYCSDRCRQRARKGSKALRYRRGQNRQISLSHPIEPVKEFQPTFDILDFARAKPKAVTERAYKHLELERVNASTWKVVDPKIKTDVPAKIGFWAGHRTTKALAWVIDLGYGQWIARRGDEVCNPTNLAQAKRQALAMAVGGIGDYQVSDPIEEFQQVSAIMEDRYPEEFPAVIEDRPPEIGGGLKGDDVQLDYHEDGYPKLPACLDRRRKPEPLAEAA